MKESDLAVPNCLGLTYLVAVPLALLLGTQAAWSQGTVVPDAQIRTSQTAKLAPIMPMEDRLSYLRKLKAFLEEDPLDMDEFERQFDLKLECRPWRSTGKICEYRTEGVRWPYAEFDDRSNAVRYSLHGDGSEDALWINLLYPGNRYAHNCITGVMVQQVFTPPEWTPLVGTATTKGPEPSQVLLLAIDGHDRQQRRISLVSAGVKGCTGKLQISIHPR